MHLTQLKYFQAVCTYQTASAAAEYLHISQPSLSNAIKELEREFGVALFRRRHRGMILTPEGEVLLKMSRELLARAAQTEQVMNELGNERKTLRLGVPPMIGSLLLPHIYRGFLTTHHEVLLEITEGGRRELQEKLSEDFLDMVFLPHSRPLDKGLASLRVARLEIVCCTSKEHRLSSKAEIEPQDLADIPIVLFKDGFYQTEEIKRWFSVSGIKPDILLQTEQLSTIETIISHNVAAGFLFRQLIDKAPDLVAIPTKSPIYVDVSLVWKRDTYFFNCMKKFKEYFINNNPFREDNRNV